MPKLPSERLWDLTHKDKLKEYNAKYLSDKLKITLVLEKETAEAINKLYPEEISMPAKIKAILQTWIASENEKPS